MFQCWYIAAHFNCPAFNSKARTNARSSDVISKLQNLLSVMALAGFEGFGRIPQFFEKDSQIPQYLDQYIQSNCPPVDLTDGKTVL